MYEKGNELSVFFVTPSMKKYTLSVSGELFKVTDTVTFVPSVTVVPDEGGTRVIEGEIVSGVWNTDEKTAFWVFPLISLYPVIDTL